MTERRAASDEADPSRWPSSGRSRWRRGIAVLPGLAAAGLVAWGAYAASLLLPGFISDVGLAVVFGATVATLLRLPATVRPGIDYAMQRLLRVGIVAPWAPA